VNGGLLFSKPITLGSSNPRMAYKGTSIDNNRLEENKLLKDYFIGKYFNLLMHLQLLIFKTFSLNIFLQHI
jgi:hypothetical protein